MGEEPFFSKRVFPHASIFFFFLFFFLFFLFLSFFLSFFFFFFFFFFFYILTLVTTPWSLKVGSLKNNTNFGVNFLIMEKICQKKFSVWISSIP